MVTYHGGIDKASKRWSSKILHIRAVRASGAKSSAKSCHVTPQITTTASIPNIPCAMDMTCIGTSSDVLVRIQRYFGDRECPIIHVRNSYQKWFFKDFDQVRCREQRSLVPWGKLTLCVVCRNSQKMRISTEFA